MTSFDSDVSLVGPEKMADSDSWMTWQKLFAGSASWTFSWIRKPWISGLAIWDCADPEKATDSDTWGIWVENPWKSGLADTWGIWPESTIGPRSWAGSSEGLTTPSLQGAQGSSSLLTRGNWDSPLFLAIWDARYCFFILCAALEDDCNRDFFLLIFSDEDFALVMRIHKKLSSFRK